MFDNWVTRYELSYSLNGKHWFMVKDKMKNGGGTRVSKQGFRLREEAGHFERLFTISRPVL